MPNEAQIIPQPDSIPGAYETGYQAQNILLEAQRNGFDGSAPYASSSTEITLPIGGPIDVNGVLYSLTINTVLTPSSINTDYYIHLSGSGDNLTPILSTDAGTFDGSKNARYASGIRVLDWIVRRGASDVTVAKMIDKQGLTAVDQSLRGNEGVMVGGATLGGALLPTTVPVTSSLDVAAGDSFILPRGVWTISFGSFMTPGDVASIAMRIGAGNDWIGIARYDGDGDPQSSDGFTVFSSGDNIRLSVLGSLTMVYYLQKY